MKKMISLILISVMLLLLVSGCGTKASTEVQKSTVKVPGVTASTINIGGLFDMTGPDNNQESPEAQGIQDYIMMTNENGGVFGRKITYKVEDTQYQPQKAVAAFRKLNEQGIFAIVGQAGSGIFAALDPEIRETKTPAVGAATNNLINNHPYAFSSMVSLTNMGKIYVERVVETYKGQGKPKIALFAIPGTPGNEFKMGVEDKAKALGVSVVLEEFIPNDIKDNSAQITKLKQSGADVLLTLITLDMFASLLRDMNRLGAGDIPVLSAYGDLDSSLFETVGKEASKNNQTIHSLVPYTGEGPSLDELRKYAEKSKVSPKAMSNMNYIYGWVIGKIFVEGINRAGKDLTRENFIQAMEGIKNLDTGGISAPVTYGPNQHEGITSGRFYSYDFDKKQIVPISDWYKVN
ncbi:MAG: hypothetical protein APF81_22245 [Desulfosporosinus sp. BRH_c37]|nr:MAG: hypothetical protein APF81_22245 [Desulfosporosinus sp. BRH_c37]